MSHISCSKCLTNITDIEDEFRCYYCGIITCRNCTTIYNSVVRSIIFYNKITDDDLQSIDIYELQLFYDDITSKNMNDFVSKHHPGFNSVDNITHSQIPGYWPDEEHNYYNRKIFEEDIKPLEDYLNIFTYERIDELTIKNNEKEIEEIVEIIRSIQLFSFNMIPFVCYKCSKEH